MNHYNYRSIPRHHDIRRRKLEQTISMKYEESQTEQEAAQRDQLQRALAESSAALNSQHQINEFGASLRVVQKMQGAVKTPEGGLIQFYADTDSNHEIVNVLEARAGVQTMYTHGQAGHCVLEAHVNGFSVLLQGSDPRNVRSLFAYAMQQIDDRGGNLDMLEPITLYAEDQQGYQEAMETFVDEFDMHVPIALGSAVTTIGVS